MTNILHAQSFWLTLLNHRIREEKGVGINCLHHYLCRIAGSIRFTLLYHRIFLHCVCHLSYLNVKWKRQNNKLQDFFLRTLKIYWRYFYKEKRASEEVDLTLRVYTPFSVSVIVTDFLVYSMNSVRSAMRLKQTLSDIFSRTIFWRLQEC